MAVERRHVSFGGRVQGVFFRATTAEIASSLDVTGFVRNLADGTVEMEAQGEPAEVSRLIAAIRDRYEGFISDTTVTAVAVVVGEPGFQIRR